MRVEVLSVEGCPNYESTRHAVEQVLASHGVSTALLESIVVDAATAAALQFPGSPTVRVDGRDIEPGFQPGGDYAPSCRVYATAGGLRGEPELSWIEDAIDASTDALRPRIELPFPRREGAGG